MIRVPGEVWRICRLGMVISIVQWGDGLATYMCASRLPTKSVLKRHIVREGLTMVSVMYGVGVQDLGSDRKGITDRDGRVEKDLVLIRRV